jgi:hypothetical protein
MNCSKSDYGYVRPIALAMSRPSLTVAALRLVAESLRSFFYPQFENVLLHRRPVVNVDHPLDSTIPFDPSYIKKYLEFVRLWIGSFYKIWKLYGEEALPGLVGYVDAIRRLYVEAGSIYRISHTTTTRPAKNYSLRFALLHAADPHLDCVPSLHILAVIANWRLASDLVGRLGPEKARGLGGAEVELWIGILRDEAIAITESVLFVKQHSVNCVGASLYYLKRRIPGFGEAEATAFIGDLFASGGGRLPNAGELRRAMLDICAAMDKAYAQRPDEGWRFPIVDFIADCAG